MKQFHHQIYNRHDHTDRRADTSKDRRQTQTDLRIGGHTEHRSIVEPVKIVVCLACAALRLDIWDLLALITKLRHDSAQKRRRIVKLPQNLNKIAVIQTRTGKMLNLLDIGEFLYHLVIAAPQRIHDRVFLASRLDADDNLVAIFPLMDIFRDHIDRILKICHHADHAVAGTL